MNGIELELGKLLVGVAVCVGLVGALAGLAFVYATVRERIDTARGR